MFAKQYSKEELREMIPGLSKWQIDQARHHAFEEGPGQPVVSTLEILGDATFEHYKWDSNVQHLEADDSLEDIEDQSYAKQQLLVKPSESKLLGLKWNKHTDTLGVTFPTDDTPTTKRGVLSKLAKIYDPLGLVSPLTLEGKLIY